MKAILKYNPSKGIFETTDIAINFKDVIKVPLSKELADKVKFELREMTGRSVSDFIKNGEIENTDTKSPYYTNLKFVASKDSFHEDESIQIDYEIQH